MIDEKRIAEYWEKNKIFEKSVEERPKDKEYIFYDGPPFATGLPHYGHILGMTSKDLFPRYWTMKGYRVERKWGWDCHGLPIENVVEKKLGIKTKKEIEELAKKEPNEERYLFVETEKQQEIEIFLAMKKQCEKTYIAGVNETLIVIEKDNEYCKKIVDGKTCSVPLVNISLVNNLQEMNNLLNQYC
ncbi:hypothetical protein D6777_03655 [Candidatus Woesearchaeota archaeon]|nr:MAG: hypothetical protein D6777_03655 [Candidatus Woesearchaeota archaeon]